MLQNHGRSRFSLPPRAKRWVFAVFNFALIVAVLTAFKLWKDETFGQHYAHDPQCQLNEPVYKVKPCIVTGEWFPRSTASPR